MMGLGAFFHGGDRTRPDTLPWQLTAALVLGATLVVSEQLVISAADLGQQSSSANAGALASTTLVLLASLGSVSLLLLGLIFSILEARLRKSLRRVETELQRRSYRDGLTRLPNRLMFDGTLAQAVQQAEQSGERMALLFIDLDGFKPVNESLGHHMGDSQRARDCGAPEAFLAPWRPDRASGRHEFLVLICNNPSTEDARIFTERLQSSIGEPCNMNGREAAVSSSVGIAMYPEHGGLSDLIKYAEAAMRSVKSNGGASNCFFESRMVTGAREQFDSTADLRRALAEGQLQLLYQPKVHAPSGEITGAEALMRWHQRAARAGRADDLHSDRRALRPDRRDRQLADRRGSPAGRRLRRRGLAHAGRDQPFSAYQLRHADLADCIDAPCADRINPQSPTCEITGVGGDGRRVERDPHGREARRHGRQHLDRRFRHWLFESRLPQESCTPAS